MSRVRVLVIDGQGGGLGRQLTAALAAGCPDIELTAVGTNSIAASAMLKAGAHRAATGENAWWSTAAGRTSSSAPSASSSPIRCWARSPRPWRRRSARAVRRGCLIPINHCDNIVVGVPDQPIGQLVTAAVEKVSQLCSSGCR